MSAQELKYQNVTAIDDLKERASSGKYSEEEADVRKKLASLYRLVDFLGWSEGIYNHLTARSPNNPDQFLILPFGFLYHEVTASSLIKVDARSGDIVDCGSTNFGYINRGYTLHSAVLQNRPDVNCVIHLHIPEIVAIASLKNGFIPFSQHSAILGPVSTYDFQGILVDLDERKAIVNSLGKNNTMLLRNHGFVVCGKTVEEAFLRTYLFIYHVKAQACLGDVPLTSVILPSEKSAQMTYHELAGGENNGWDKQGQKIHWEFGELDWQAWMRLLDSMGMKTGFTPKLHLWKTG